MQKGYKNNEIDMGIINAYSFINIMETPNLLPIAARVKLTKKLQKSFYCKKKQQYKIC